CPAPLSGTGETKAQTARIERAAHRVRLARRARNRRQSKLFGWRYVEFGVAPDGLRGAVAPAARAIERMHADLVELVHGADPVWTHPVGVVVGRLADIGQPMLAVERFTRDIFGAFPRGRLGDLV